MKIGRYILGLLVLSGIYIGTKNIEVGNNYNNTDCNAEFIDTTIINTRPTDLPKSLRSIDGCNYENVRYSNEETRIEYFALTLKQREIFKIKGRVQGDTLTVNTIYHDSLEYQKTVVLYVSDRVLSNNCIYTTWNKYCFKNKVRAPVLTKIEAIVDTNNQILTFKELERYE